MQTNASDPLEIAGSILKLAPSGLFDREWYLAAYRTELADGGDPLTHFCDRGWRKGNDPSFYFSTKYYLAENPDVAQAGVNPLVHYLTYGEAENRPPSGHFLPGWYKAAQHLPPEKSALADYLARRRAGPANPNPGFEAAWYGGTYGHEITESDLFEDYIRHGIAAGRDASPEIRLIRKSGLFDEQYYRAQYKHVAEQNLPLIYHFCSTGWTIERTRPNAMFDTAWYLSVYPDVAAAGLNPLAHYIQFGEPENRPPSTEFDPAAYRREQKLAEEVPPLAHFLQHPQAKATPPAPFLAAIADQPAAPEAERPWRPDAEAVARAELFDINYYLTNYPDIRESPLDPLEHFCRYGWREGRRPNAYFDSDWYAKTYLADAPGVNPLVHYAAAGEQNGNRPIVYFDPSWYRQQYRLPKGHPPLLHFLQNRRSQKYSPLKLFDVERYIALHGAKIGANRDPFAHYLRVGISSDVDPGPDFDARQYRVTTMGETPPRARPKAGSEIHEKLRRETFNPLVHYLLHNVANAEAESWPQAVIAPG